MKIGFDAKRAFMNKSGLGNYSRDIIKSLNDFYPENEYFLFSPENKTSMLDQKYLKHIISPKIKIGKSYWRSVLMGNDIKKQNLDVFHGLSNELPLNIKNVNALKVVTIHDLIFLKFPSLYSLIDRQIYNYKFKKACVDADKVIATSNQTKNDIIQYYKIPENKIEIIYQSCNENFKTLLSSEVKDNIRKKYNLPENFILTVGTIERRKNALNVLKAIYYFNIDINYVLIGRNTEYCKELFKFIDEHKLNKKVYIINNVSNEDLPAVYQQAKAFVYPSIYEGFGIPILEAFNSGIPVITSEKGATSEVGGDAAILIEPLNSKSIGEAIKSILVDEKLSKLSIEKGFERAKLFDREVVCNNIMNFYKKL